MTKFAFSIRAITTGFDPVNGGSNPSRQKREGGMSNIITVALDDSICDELLNHGISVGLAEHDLTLDKWTFYVKKVNGEFGNIDSRPIVDKITEWMESHEHSGSVNIIYSDGGMIRFPVIKKSVYEKQLVFGIPKQLSRQIHYCGFVVQCATRDTENYDISFYLKQREDVNHCDSIGLVSEIIEGWYLKTNTFQKNPNSTIRIYSNETLVFSIVPSIGCKARKQTKDWWAKKNKKWLSVKAYDPSDKYSEMVRNITKMKKEIGLLLTNKHYPYPEQPPGTDVLLVESKKELTLDQKKTIEELVRSENERREWPPFIAHVEYVPINENPAAKKQISPKGAGREITPLVIADLQSRSDMGEKKYGEPLKAFNGRDSMMDLYQEILDAAVYCRQVMEEKEKTIPEGFQKLIERIESIAVLRTQQRDAG